MRTRIRVGVAALAALAALVLGSPPARAGCAWPEQCGGGLDDIHGALVLASRAPTWTFSQVADLFSAFLGDRYDACRYGWGWLKGGGYDATTNRFAWTCYYPWTVTHGGGSGSYATPTTSGTDSAYAVACTGVYDPDPACLESGEDIIVNATPNIALVVDFTADGGDVYLPVRDGKWMTGYVASGCGEQANGTPNNCPILRAPNDGFEGGQIIQAVRGITIHLEGEDGDGIERVVDGSGRPRRTGAYILIDSGHDIGGYDNGAAAASTRRQNSIGLAAGNNACGGATDGICTTGAGSSTRGIPENAAAHEFGVLDDPDHSAATWCIDDRTAGSTGVCDADIRRSCSTNGDCTAINGAWACIGGATLLSQQLTAARDRIIWGWNGHQQDAEGADLSTILGGEVAFASIDTGTTCDSGNGNPATLWTAENTAGKSFDLATIEDVFPVHYGSRMNGGGFEGGTIAGANGATYEIQAADVWTCGPSHDGDVVLIMDDDGSCSSTAGALDGGGSTVSECKCDGGTPTWTAAACGTVPGSGGDGDKRGCYDEGAAITIGSAVEGRARNLHITGFYHPAANPIIDHAAASNAAVRGQNLVEHTQFTWNYGRIFDIGSMVDAYDLLFADNDGTGGNLISIGFSGDQNWDTIRIERSTGQQLFSFGEGGQVHLTNVTFIGNNADRMMEATRFQDIRICGVRGYGNSGGLLHIEPNLNTSVLGHLELCDVDYQASAELEASGGQDDYEAFIRITDQNENRAAATWYGPFDFHDIHVETEAANAILLAFDGATPDEVDTNIDEVRALVSLRDASIMNEHYTGTAKAICTRDDTDAGATTAANCHDIHQSRFMPRMEDIYVNGVGQPDYPYTQVSASDAGDCTASPTANGEVGPGTVVAIYDDTSANVCTDAGADGVLDGGGTDKSVCMCGASGWASF